MRKITLAVIVASCCQTLFMFKLHLRRNISRNIAFKPMQTTIGIKEEATAEEFIRKNSNVEAAINGPYFWADERIAK